jgi:membrane-bound serine protease (ClpP class)
MSTVERFMYALSNPALALILLNLGILGIVFELQNPGTFLPGIAGVILLLLGLFSLGMLPVNGVGVALIFFGFMLFLVELFVPTAGILAVGGVISLVLGALMLFQSSAPELAPSLPIVLTVTLSTGALVLFAIRQAVKAQGLKAQTGREELVGRLGTARTALTPAGMVFLEGELWTAVADSPLPEGTPVVVSAVDGLKLLVRPADTVTPTPQTSPPPHPPHSASP